MRTNESGGPRAALWRAATAARDWRLWLGVVPVAAVALVVGGSEEALDRWMAVVDPLWSAFVAVTGSEVVGGIIAMWAALLGLVVWVAVLPWRLGSATVAANGEQRPRYRRAAAWCWWVGVAMALFVVYRDSFNVAVVLARPNESVLSRVGGDAWLLAALVTVVGLVVLLAVYRLRGDRPTEWVERGARVVEADEAQADLWKGRPAATLPSRVIVWGGVGIPEEVETMHTLICGGTGSGKSQAILRVLAAIRERGGRAVVADSGGEYFARFGRPGDVLLCPTDARSVAWSPWRELRDPWDTDRLAQAAVPGGGGNDQWAAMGQLLISSAMRSLHAAGVDSTSELLRVALSATPDELRDLLTGTAAAGMVDSERTVGSIRATIGRALTAWQVLPDNGDFSIRDWVSADTGDGWLWLPYQDAQMAMFRRLIASWIDLAIVEGLALGESRDRQLWFIADEADTLGRVSSLDQGLAKLRKCGGRVVMACQTISQLRATYGRDVAQTIVANASTKLLLRAGDNETARYFADELGDQEIGRVNASFDAGARDQAAAIAAASSATIQRATRAAVMASEIQQLPSLSGYLRVAGYGPSALVQLPVMAIEPSQAPYLPASAGPARAAA